MAGFERSRVGIKRNVCQYGGREGSPAAGTAGMGGYRRRVGAGMSGYRRRVRAGTDNYAT